MGPLVIGAILGAASGLIKAKRDEENARREAELASVTARYSPWTGMKPSIPGQTDPEGSVLEGLSAGMAMGQKYKDAKAADTTSKGLSLTEETAGNKVLYDDKGNPYKLSSEGGMSTMNQSPWEDMLAWEQQQKMKGR